MDKRYEKVDLGITPAVCMNCGRGILGGVADAVFEGTLRNATLLGYKHHGKCPKVVRRRIRLLTSLPCDDCHEEMPSGMTALYDDVAGTHHHYGKCKGKQRSEDVQNAMKRIGLNEETVGSMNKIVDYLYRDERKDFESRGEDEVDGHIFLDIERVKEFLGGL